jgi:hypothetical protein
MKHLTSYLNATRRFRTMALALVALIALVPAPSAWAQGCVLCYTSLMGANPSAIRAFQLAMMVLLVPALTLFIGIFLLIRRRGAAAESAQALN